MHYDCQCYMVAASHILENRVETEDHSTNHVLPYLLAARGLGIEEKSTFEEVVEAYVSISAGDTLLALTSSLHESQTQIRLV